VPDLTVAENILLGDLPGKRFLVNWAKVRAETQTILKHLDLDLDPGTPVAKLGVAKQQAVEIAKALYQKARVVIMDEPTSAFGRTEVERLFDTVRTLRQQGIGIIYISHHLEEVFAISDRVTVLRDGLVVGSRSTPRTSPQELMNMMVGRDLSGISVKEVVIPGEVLLKVENLGRGDIVQDVSFELRRGEILGIDGIVGSGRTEMARLIFGIDKPDRGRVIYKGAEVHIAGPRDAIRSGGNEIV
jgi:ribose transport system ATP-binding protein